jgi:hypothetical protein
MAKGTGNATAGAQAPAQTVTTVMMTQDKVTKNAVRYKEDHVDETEADRIGQLYIQKSTFPNGAPKQVRVTVESVG